MSTGNNIRRTITNLRDPQQIRELNRQLEWIWGQLLGGISKKSLAKKCIEDLSQLTQTDIMNELTNGDPATSELLAALASFAVASVGAHVFLATELTSMLSNIFTLSKKSNGTVQISNLVVTADNISGAISELSSAVSDLQSRLNNLSVSATMCDQTVWDKVQNMINASGT